MKKSKVFSYLILLFGIILAMSYYTNAFNLSEENLESSLRKVLKNENIELLDTGVIEKNDKYLLIHYLSSEKNGLLLVKKGLNGNYQVIDRTEADENVYCIEFLISRVDYLVFFGGDSNEINSISFSKSLGNHEVTINSKNFMLVKEGRSYADNIELKYITSIDAKKVYVESVAGSTWQGIFTHIISISILTLSVLVFLLLVRKNKYSIREYDQMKFDGQRIKHHTTWRPR